MTLKSLAENLDTDTIPIPTTETQTQSNKEVFDYDELLQELSVETHNQALYEQKETTGPGEEITNTPAPFSPFDQQPKKEIDPEKALRSGRRFAKITDTILAMGASGIAKESDVSQYRASEEDVEDLAEAWADVGTQYDIEMNPILNLILIVLITYLPAYQEALSERKFKLMAERIERLETRVNETENEQRDNDTTKQNSSLRVNKESPAKAKKDRTKA